MKNNNIISQSEIASKIYIIRGKKVMLDMDLAVLYEVETKILKRAVKRHINRFPEDFMFELTKDEFNYLRCQFGTANWEKVRFNPVRLIYYYMELHIRINHPDDINLIDSLFLFSNFFYNHIFKMLFYFFIFR